jgi:hypothetical protein
MPLPLWSPIPTHKPYAVYTFIFSASSPFDMYFVNFLITKLEMDKFFICFQMPTQPSSNLAKFGFSTTNLGAAKLFFSSIFRTWKPYAHPKGLDEVDSSGAMSPEVLGSRFSGVFEELKMVAWLFQADLVKDTLTVEELEGKGFEFRVWRIPAAKLDLINLAISGESNSLHLLTYYLVFQSFLDDLTPKL